MSKGSNLFLVLKGVAMGIAEVIPGVSGGTIAFITGIYEKLINTIKAFGPDAIRAYKKDGFKGLLNAINADFIFFLMVGMVGGFVLGIFVISYLLEAYPEPLWSFFFGLILASAFFMGSQLDKWKWTHFISFVIGVVIAYGITILSPAEGSTSPFYILISGILAISALLLPGISGSFVLLLMGMYTIIMPAIKDVLKYQDISSLYIVLIFGLGCIIGLIGFSRVLSWLFAKYKEVSFAILTGFLIGALNKVWPWRNVTQILKKDTGELLEVKDYSNFHQIDIETIKVMKEVNVLPTQYLMDTPKTLICVLAFIVGVCIVWLMSKMDNQDS